MLYTGAELHSEKEAKKEGRRREGVQQLFRRTCAVYTGRNPGTTEKFTHSTGRNTKELLSIGSLEFANYLSNPLLLQNT